MNDVMIPNQPDQLYARMSHAVGECYSLDDCANIAKHADAIAAYFKQIKDEDLVRKFLAIKVRAWRRIGEVLRVVDASDCETKSAHIRKVRAHFKGDPTVRAMTDSALGNALKLSDMPLDFFERMVEGNPNVYAILAAYQLVMREEWEATPAGQQELARRKEIAEQNEIVRREREAVQAAKKAEQDKRMAEAKAEMQQRLDQQQLDHEAMEAAREEVGFTMDRRDREDMKEVVFLIKRQIHEIMRQAAFDNRITMQAILRAGLVMWLFSHGYPVNPEEFNAPKNQTPAKKGKAA